jgi:uncharacterized protein YfaS (alpha-2-macroglobulin family)
VGTYPLAGEPLTDRLVVYFSENVAARDGSSPVSFEPALAVTSTTTTGNAVSLTLDRETVSEGTYTLKFADNLLSTNGTAFAAPEIPIVFTVRDTRGPLATSLRRVIGGDDTLQLALGFNVAMAKESLPAKVHVFDAAGAEVVVALEASEDGKTFTMNLPAAVAQPVRVVVDAGALDAGGQTGSQKEVALTYPSRTLEVTKVGLAAAGGENDGALRLVWNMSDEISAEEVTKHLSAKDKEGNAVAVKVSASESRYDFQTETPADAALPITFELKKGLPSANGNTELSEDRLLDYPKGQLAVTQISWRSSDGNESLYLELNETVRWAEVLRNLAVVDAVSGAPISVEPTDAEGVGVILTLYGAGQSDTLRVTLQPGLRGLKLGMMSQAYTQDLDRQTEDLDIGYNEWDMRGAEGLGLRVNFNQPLDVTTLRQSIRFAPKVENVTVEHSYGNTYRVGGDFAHGTEYMMVLANTLRDPRGGSPIESEFSVPLDMSPESEPGAGFDFEDEIYFPRRTSGILPLMAQGVEEVTVNVSQMFPNNIAMAVNELSEGNTWSDFEGSWAKHLAEKMIPTPGAKEGKAKLKLDLNEVMPAGVRGVFGLRLTPEPYGYTTKIVVWTDLGLMSHWLDDALIIFVHDLFTIAPSTNAKVTVWSGKNQILGEAVTDADGIARFDALDKSLGTPAVVVCETEGDYTFLQLTPRTDDPVPVTEAMPRYDKAAYDAFVYADRNLYRPGETVHARWVARTNYGDALASVPLQMLLTNPDGAEVQKEAVTLSALGTGGLDLATDKAWPTGKYTLTVGAPDATPAGSLSFSLEDFVPNRIKAEVSYDGGPWSPQTAYAVRIKAEQLFGGPARGQKAKGSIILRKGEFKHDAWQGYRFTNDTDFKPEVAPLGESQTGDDGIATFSYTFPGSSKITFPVQATVRGEVLEAGARPVSDTKDVLLFPDTKLLGVALSSDGDAGVKVDVAAIQPDGTPAPVATVKIIVEREDWSYYVRRYDSHNEPNFTKSYQAVAEQTVTLAAGRGAASFTLGEYSWGYHRVRVESADTPMKASAAFYKNWNGIDAADTPRPSLIKLTLNKPDYTVGEEVELRIESPFDGRALVVLQGEKFHRVLPVDVANAVGIVRFTLDQPMYPNVWAGVTVVHKAPADRAQVYPYSSFAMVNVPARDPGRKLDVVLSGAPEEMRPGTDLTISIETKGADGAPRSAEVTLAAVDEGIHGILDYANPDPWNYLQRFRSPDYRRAHYYDRVAYDFDAEAIGGDLASRLAKRSATIGENWIKPVALWSGAVQTDATGKATVTLPVPEFTGQLRLVAVAVDATATGAAAGQVYVRRPYMLQTSLPRFVLPGDTFQARATVFNTTGAAINAKVGWNPSGALSPQAGEAALSVGANAELGTLAALAAGTGIGQGQIEWKLDIEGAPQDSTTQQSPLPVRPPAAYQSRHALVVVPPGESQVFKNTEFVEDASTTLSLTVGADPALRVFNALKYLIGYPHGCVEQTTSQCFPLYVLRKSSALIGNTLHENERIEAYLERGIQRLLSMQTSTGGLGYWAGANEANRYGSVYALHFLVLVARDGELTVPEGPLHQLKEYVRRVSNEGSDTSASGLYLRAYAHFVLALSGDQEALEQIGRYDDITLPRPARYLLAAALAIQTGDAALVADYLKTKPVAPYLDYERGGTLNTETRGEAVKLLALVQMDGPLKDMEVIVDRIATALDQPYYTNTQEVAFAAAALGMYFDKVSTDQSGAKGSVVGPEGTREIAQGDLFTLKHEGPSGEFTVTNTGSTGLYVNFSQSGMPVNPVLEATSEGDITLTRNITLTDGTPVPEGKYKQGETYLVELRLQGGSGLDNLVISDLLPAGLEVENPRLDANALAGANITGMATPSHVDIRDDRLVIAFETVPSSDTRYFYALRAVTPGSYQHPGAVAECMYDAKFRASTAHGRAEVVE